MTQRSLIALPLCALAALSIVLLLEGQRSEYPGVESRSPSFRAGAALSLVGHPSAGVSTRIPAEGGSGVEGPHDRASTLRGRTVDRAGGPVQGVMVWAAEYRPNDMFFREGPWRQCASGEGGAFEFASLDADYAVLLAQGPTHASINLARVLLGGLRPFVVDLRRGGATDRDLVVAPLARVLGTVRDESGRPVPDFPVQAFFTRVEGHWMTGTDDLPLGNKTLAVRTDSDGTFSIDRLVVGLSYHVRPARSAGVSIAVLEGANGPLTLTLDESVRTAASDAQALVRGRAEIRVVDAKTGTSLPKAEVRAEADGTWAIGRRPLPAMPMGVGSEGGVVLEDVGPLTINAAADGYFGAEYVEWRPGDGTLTIPLTPGLTIRGRVALPDGTAPGDTTIYARHMGGEPDFGDQPECTYEDGSFTISRLRESPYRISAVSAMGRGEADAFAGDEDVRIELEPVPQRPPKSRLHVVGPDGASIRSCSARVYVREEGGLVTRRYSPWGDPTLPTDREWWIEVFDFRASDGGRDPAPGARLHGPVDAAEPGATVTVRTASALGIQGRVVAEDGQPAAAVRVMAIPCFPSLDESRLRELDPRHHAVSWSSRDGHFSLTGLGPYPYRLVAQAPGFAWSAESEPIQAGAREAVVRLPGGVNARVRVVDEQGRAILGVRLQVSFQDAARSARNSERWIPAFSGAADQNGRLHMEGLPAERKLLLGIYPDDEEKYLCGWEDDWQPGDERVVVRTRHDLEGHVLDHDGKPVPDAHLVGSPQDSTFRYCAGRRADTDENGHFQIRGLPAEPVRIDVHLSGRRDALRQIVRVPCDPITLRLDTGGRLRVRFSRGDLPPQQMQCHLSADGERSILEYVRQDHILDVRGLDPSKTYTLFAMRYADSGEPTLVGHLCDLKPRDAHYDCPLVAGGHAVVEVSGLPPGAHPGYVWVELLDDGVNLLAMREDDGAWHLRGIPPGRRAWRVRVRYGHDEPRPTAWTVVRDGHRVSVDLR